MTDKNTRPAATDSGSETGPAVLDLAEQVAVELRERDRERFLLAMLAPPADRWAVVAVHAFRVELERVPLLTSEPLLGRIRLQWWRDAMVDGSDHDGTAALVRAAIDRFDLDRTWFFDAIDAWETRLDDEMPIRTINDAQEFAERSAGILGGAVYRVLGGRTQAGLEAARLAASAHAMATLARGAGGDLANNRVFLPGDGLSVSDLGDAVRGQCSRALRNTLGTVTDHAIGMVDEARRLMPRVERSEFAAFAPATMAERHVMQLRRVGLDPFDPRLARPGPGMAFALTVKRLRRRF